jgi:hypothetical protein
MELHVALSLRLDAIEAHRLANAYRAEVLAEAADAINALPQDYECDPGRGDAAELLRVMATAIEEKSSRPAATAAHTTVDPDRLYRDAYATGRQHAGVDGWVLSEYTPVFTRSDGSDRPISELRHMPCGGLVQGVGPHTLIDLMALASQHECQPRAERGAGESSARQEALLEAILLDPSGRWKSGRAVTALRRIGYYPVSPSTASHDLAALAAAGHLIRHEEKGVRWYEVARREGGERRG